MDQQNVSSVHDFRRDTWQCGNISLLQAVQRKVMFPFIDIMNFIIINYFSINY